MDKIAANIDLSVEHKLYKRQVSILTTSNIINKTLFFDELMHVNNNSAEFSKRKHGKPSCGCLY